MLSQLNAVQRQAVECTEGPSLILAGAGSGKTRVLTYRIAHLVHKGLAAPWEILAMTFTNKAAGEMKLRISEMLDTKDPLWIGTFHSIFAKILRWEAEALNYTRDFVIYDSDDQERLIKSIMSDLNISKEQLAPKAIKSAISNAKSDLITPSQYLKQVHSYPGELISKVYPEYENRLRKFQAFDFDDLITIPIRLFEQHPQILEKYRNRFKYILVDEYQDTNRAQYTLLRQLASSHRNLCVVGDDDQSIYRWRGADIRNILEFEKDYKDAQIFRLEQNYRSTEAILTAANSVVKRNKGRKGKTLWTEIKGGEKVSAIEVQDDRQESSRVVEKIQKEVFSNKRTFKDFAVLYRTNAQSRNLEDGLRRAGISYTIVGGVRFYERKEIKDILAYLRIIVNPQDSISFKRIINFPTRGIGATSLERFELFAKENDLGLFDALTQIADVDTISPRIRKKMREFHFMIQKYIDLKVEISPNELVHALVDETGLMRMYKEDMSDEARARVENIRELLAAISEYAAQTEQPSLAEFLEQVSLVADMDQWDDRSNVVTLMTLHCAKGLEFPVVFITGLEEGLFPGFRSHDDPEAMEEERRLFYVGMTRAMEKLYLLYAQRRRVFNEINSRPPSRFLEEIDKSVLDHLHVVRAMSPASEEVRHKPRRRIDQMFSDSMPDYESFSQESGSGLETGMYVSHASFGRGKISKLLGSGAKQTVTVKFEGGMTKKFLAQYAKFDIL
ncbi:UvrD-helicase domain-containing protein [bacterium]|nr:UvrD-helicase domain-containing protein [bacterium]